MYNPDKQFRCSVIRGKAKSAIDNLLPAYAKIIQEITPCSREDFENNFDVKLSRVLPTSSPKTLANHRTEIAGKLFGMFFINQEEVVTLTERTQKFLSDNDQPAFFKDLCYKFQSISGMDSVATIVEKAQHGVSIKPMCYTVWLLSEAKAQHLILSEQDIGYYLLNNEDALAGKTNPSEILEAIKNDRKNGQKKEVFEPGKASSYYWQHIHEQLAYLELANVIEVTETGVFLNSSEQKTIDRMIDNAKKPLAVDPKNYDLETVEGRAQFIYDWTEFFSKVSENAEDFSTTLTSLGIKDPTNWAFSGTTEMGDEGENVALAYERERVSQLDARLQKRVSLFGKIHGLGYDILSVMAEKKGQEAEFAKYIEVKATKRVTEPDFENQDWMDSVNITKNEWNAMTQHKEFFSIYRIYFCKNSVIIAVINNPWKKVEDESVGLVPLTYRVDFTNTALSQKITRSLHNGI